MVNIDRGVLSFLFVLIMNLLYNILLRLGSLVNSCGQPERLRVRLWANL